MQHGLIFFFRLEKQKKEPRLYLSVISGRRRACGWPARTGSSWSFDWCLSEALPRWTAPPHGCQSSALYPRLAGLRGAVGGVYPCAPGRCACRLIHGTVWCTRRGGRRLKMPCWAAGWRWWRPSGTATQGNPESSGGTPVPHHARALHGSNHCERRKERVTLKYHDHFSKGKKKPSIRRN